MQACQAAGLLLLSPGASSLSWIHPVEAQGPSEQSSTGLGGAGLNPSIWEAEAGGSLEFQTSLCLYGEFPGQPGLYTNLVSK